MTPAALKRANEISVALELIRDAGYAFKTPPPDPYSTVLQTQQGDKPAPTLRRRVDAVERAIVLPPEFVEVTTNALKLYLEAEQERLTKELEAL